ncbi:hypothetical protein CROQUDRAFT_53009 [Cronartium quercuum f. sp. fusiforme G11]|uniref:M-phase inducer phosphatase n=1 Tax=Cronartium quercuum f. sp. fusiforme G11 TaxID=708437 RepID=A0A9P6T6M6_9BASI|nr:hypothetical protein CROQUDRAFT_53009 [Cronartium quercuum f. sp. fusiforme G11]
MGFSEKERAGKILPCHKVSDDGLMRISPKTMDELLEGRYDRAISRKIVIDCRFKYEYEGGHIRDAINVREKEHVEQVLLSPSTGLFVPPEPSESGKCDGAGLMKKVVLVFHCEYSAMRAPTIAKHLREKDRHLNMPHYPALHYPEVYILEGGYAKYHAHSPHHCDGSYVPMDDPLHRTDRHADLNMFRAREGARAVRKKGSKKVMRITDENCVRPMEADESPCGKASFGAEESRRGVPMRRMDSNLRVLDEQRRR